MSTTRLPDARASEARVPAWRLLEHLPGLRSMVIALSAFSVVISALMLVPSLYMMQVYDRVLSSRSEYTLIALTVITLGLFALMCGLDWIRGAVLVRAAALFEARHRDAVFRSAFASQAAGVPPVATVQDLATVRQFLAGPVPALMLDAPLALLSLAVAFVVDLWLGVFICIAIALLVVLAWLSRRLSQQRLDRAGLVARQASDDMNEAVRQAEVIRALGMLDAITRRWLRGQQQSTTLQFEANDLAARVNAVSRFVRISAQSLVLGLGAVLVIEDRITAGMMIGTSLLLSRTLAPLDGLIGATGSIANAQTAAARLLQLLRPSGESPQGGSASMLASMSTSMRAAASQLAGPTLPQARGHLSLEGLSAAPPGWPRPLLRGVDLKVSAGTVLGVVGPSGAGKSVLARVIAGVWPACAGAIRLDGADLRHWPDAQRAAATGYLPQDVELLDGSVAQNIARWRDDADDAQIIAAAIEAGAHEMILQLPDGYQTRIGPAGGTLSGGQRQRIGLARALFGGPVLVVLDEPNANLDEAGDLALQAAIERCRAAGRTVVLVTHRPGVLRLTQQLAVIEDGRLLMSGPSAQVIAALRRPAMAAVPDPQPTPQELAA